MHLLQITIIHPTTDLNLLDWSSQNILAVVLRNACYLWNATSGDINLLMNMEGANDHISSIKWVEDGEHIAIGNSDGEVQVCID